MPGKINENHYYTPNEVHALIEQKRKIISNNTNLYAYSSKWSDITYTHLNGERLKQFKSINKMFAVVDDLLKNYYFVDYEDNHTGSVATTYAREKDLKDLEEIFYLKKDFEKNKGQDYKFSVIDDYYNYNTIDAKFYALDKMLNNSYYKKNEGKEDYSFKVIKDYDSYHTIDDKFYAIDQILHKSYDKKKENNGENQFTFKVLENYGINKAETIDAKFYVVDRYLNENILEIQKSIDKNEKNISDQTSKIENNKNIIDDQAKLIEDNERHILKKIEELREIVNKNKEQISLNTKEVRPLNEMTTKIFNTLAEKANKEISLNTEIIRPKDSNESLNQMGKNNEADNNALYVMVTALTAPFIGLSLYYSSNTEENIGNEIEAF